MTAGTGAPTGPAPTDLLPARATAGQALTQCAALSWRGVLKLRRHPAGLADVVLGPAIVLVLFGVVFGGAVAGDTREYLQYVFPGIVGFMTLFATLGVGVCLSTDLATGMFDRLRGLPIVRIAPLAGAIGSDIVRQLVSLAAVMGFGLLLGVRFTTPVWSVLAACGLALAFALAVSWVWVLLALLVGDAQAVQGLGAVLVLPLAFVSTLFVPLSTMPGWLRTVASWNPVGHLVEALRALLTGGPLAGPLTATLIWMAAVVAVFAPASLVRYRRRA